VNTFYALYGKRISDLVFAVVFIILFAWLYLLIVVVFLLTFNRPIFYISRRIGKSGVTFNMYKFRTLSVNDKLSLTERQFGLGRVLRFTNLDELPQVWNILTGQMSWIGPRPLPIEYKDRFSAEQFKRHAIRPGITGLAQIKGKNELSWSKKFEWDLQYVNNLSLLLDLQIWIQTIVLLFSFKRDVSLTEKEL
jgi:lipopolysaccharide/colanic/teichoic acid biosynthesis glycosyltransferase